MAERRSGIVGRALELGERLVDHVGRGADALQRVAAAGEALVASTGAKDEGRRAEHKHPRPEPGPVTKLDQQRADRALRRRGLLPSRGRQGDA